MSPTVWINQELIFGTIDDARGRGHCRRGLEPYGSALPGSAKLGAGNSLRGMEWHLLWQPPDSRCGWRWVLVTLHSGYLNMFLKGFCYCCLLFLFFLFFLLLWVVVIVCCCFLLFAVCCSTKYVANVDFQAHAAGTWHRPCISITARNIFGVLVALGQTQAEIISGRVVQSSGCRVVRKSCHRFFFTFFEGVLAILATLLIHFCRRTFQCEAGFVVHQSPPTAAVALVTCALTVGSGGAILCVKCNTNSSKGSQKLAAGMVCPIGIWPTRQFKSRTRGPVPQF